MTIYAYLYVYMGHIYFRVPLIQKYIYGYIYIYMDTADGDGSTRLTRSGGGRSSEGDDVDRRAVGQL